MYPAVNAAEEAIAAAIAAVPQVRFYRQLGGAIDPPAVVLPLPRLVWDGPGFEPTDATWVVGLVVDRNEYTYDQFKLLGQPVGDALQSVTGVVALRNAEMGSYPAGGVELPAYLFTLEVAL